MLLAFNSLRGIAVGTRYLRKVRIPQSGRRSNISGIRLEKLVNTKENIEVNYGDIFITTVVFYQEFSRQESKMFSKLILINS